MCYSGITSMLFVIIWWFLYCIYLCSSYTYVYTKCSCTVVDCTDARGNVDVFFYQCLYTSGFTTYHQISRYVISATLAAKKITTVETISNIYLAVRHFAWSGVRHLTFNDEGHRSVTLVDYPSLKANSVFMIQYTVILTRISPPQQFRM